MHVDLHRAAGGTRARQRRHLALGHRRMRHREAGVRDRGRHCRRGGCRGGGCCGCGGRQGRGRSRIGNRGFTAPATTAAPASQCQTQHGCAAQAIDHRAGRFGQQGAGFGGMICARCDCGGGTLQPLRGGCACGRTAGLGQIHQHERAVRQCANGARGRGDVHRAGRRFGKFQMAGRADTARAVEAQQLHGLGLVGAMGAIGQVVDENAVVQLLDHGLGGRLAGVLVIEPESVARPHDDAGGASPEMGARDGPVRGTGFDDESHGICGMRRSAAMTERPSGRCCQTGTVLLSPRCG